MRAPDAQAASRRLARAWWDWPELAAEITSGRVLAVAGDVRAPGLGLEPADWQRLTLRVTHIVHAAADLRVAAPQAELRRTNVTGVAHVLELAAAAHHDHGLTRLTHVSTAYVAGLRPGEVAEDDLTAGTASPTATSAPSTRASGWSGRRRRGCRSRSCGRP